jgi:hypothetical protein
MSEGVVTVGGMPWKATDAMKERTKFVLEWERRWQETEGLAVNMAELSRMFGVSRPTGYTWVRRYRKADHDVRAVVERSHRPKTPRPRFRSRSRRSSWRRANSGRSGARASCGSGSWS